MYNDEAFMALVNERGVKLSAVAAAMGMHLTTLRRKRLGEVDFTRSEIQACCDFFNLPEMNAVFFAK